MLSIKTAVTRGCKLRHFRKGGRLWCVFGVSQAKAVK